MRKNKRWPENCVWPEPVWDGEGVAWEEDEVDPMLLDEDGRELLEIKEYCCCSISLAPNRSS